MSGAARKGVVYLVGAGPGAADLLTVRALRLLETADVVLHDDLVPREVLAVAGTQALVTSVGKRCGQAKMTQAAIHAMMVDCARQGMSVVRLKSGDPMIYGRAGEEMEALREAGVEFEIVPGVTAASAAAASAQVALTDRRTAAKLMIVTGHYAAEKDQRRPVFETAPPQDATLVVYMPGREFAALAEELMGHGWAAEVPCCAVSHAAQAGQQVRVTELGQLGALVPGPAPVVLLIGRAVAGARDSDGLGAVDAVLEPLAREIALVAGSGN